MGLFDRFKKQEPIESEYTLKKDEPANAEYKPITDSPKDRHLVKERIFLTGQAYYQDNYMKLATLNPDWDKLPENDESVTIYKYKFKNKPVKVEEDPDFENCLRVTVDGLKIGVIRNDYLDKMRQILSGEVKYISAYIHGGPYKSYGNNKELITDNEDQKFITANLGVGYIVEE